MVRALLPTVTGVERLNKTWQLHRGGGVMTTTIMEKIGGCWGRLPMSAQTNAWWGNTIPPPIVKIPMLSGGLVVGGDPPNERACT